MNVLPKIVLAEQLNNLDMTLADHDLTLRLMNLPADKSPEFAGAIVAYRTGEWKDSNSVLHIVKGYELAASYAAACIGWFDKGAGVGVMVAETKEDAELWLELTGEPTPAPAMPKTPKTMAELARLPRHEQDALIAAARKRR